MAATGQKAFEMAFILADGGCVPAWNGTDPVSGDTQVAAVINEVRSDGGDVIVSAGGYNGTKLGQVCGTAAATAAAYQEVINAYGLHAMDFDLEEPEIEISAAIANELGAAQILQRNNPGLFTSVTIPSTATGANYFGQQLLGEAKTLGFTPDDYTIMPFDGGFNGGTSQVTALQDFNAQLASTFGWSSSQVRLPRRRRAPARPPPGHRARLMSRAMSCPTAATSGPPTSGTTTRCQAAPRVRGTTTAPADAAHTAGARGSGSTGTRYAVPSVTAGPSCNGAGICSSGVPQAGPGVDRGTAGVMAGFRSRWMTFAMASTVVIP